MAKRKRYNTKRMEANIRLVYSQATDTERAEGLLWYQTAHNDAQAIADKYNVPLSHAVGVIAAISPSLSWGLNIIQASEFIGAFKGKRKLPSVGVYGRKNPAKALRILNGENPLDVLPETGPKTRAFYRCIENPIESFAVVCDRHAKCLAHYRLTDREAFSVVRKGKEYNTLATCYAKVAEEVGLQPHQLQAITWLAWRRIVTEEVPF